MLYSPSILISTRYLLLYTCSTFHRFKARISNCFKSVIKIKPVTSHTTLLIAGCCFSKCSSNKPSLLSRIRNRKYIATDVSSDDVANENHPIQSEVNQSFTQPTIMKRNLCDNIRIEQCTTNEQSGCSYERKSKRFKTDPDFDEANSAIAPSQQTHDLFCSNLKESTSLENLFSEECFLDVTESGLFNKEPNVSIQLDETKGKYVTNGVYTSENKEKRKLRPNYFVAVKISDLQIHETLKKLQEHILDQEERLQSSMILLPTLHITLMVMNIVDDNMHMRALKALQNVHEEYDDIMCSDPLRLDFKGLGHFQNRVLFAKLTMDDAYKRLCDLAESVKKHFAAVSIYSTDAKEKFTPHLTVAKLNFQKKSQKNIKKIHPSLYSAYGNQHFGQQIIKSIQLLRMAGPKDDNGYYSGDELFFSTFHPDHHKETLNSALETEQKKKEIKEKIHLLTKQVLN